MSNFAFTETVMTVTKCLHFHDVNALLLMMMIIVFMMITVFMMMMIVWVSGEHCEQYVKKFEARFGPEALMPVQSNIL